METFIFKSSCGNIGYFQKDGNSCKLHVTTRLIPIQASKNWSDWERFQNSGTQNAPKTSHDDPISKAVSYFLWDHCESVSPDVVDFHKNSYEAGTYFPRINRDKSNLYQFQTSSSSFVDEVRAYYNIVEAMEDIFKVVEPTKNNVKTFGHRIREVLIIACTEVEYLFLQALKDNGYKELHQYQTKDFVSLLDVYKLSEYEIELKMHPKLGRIRPFKDWDKDKPTKSLFWYSAYNASKHDRGGNFAEASIEAMVNAIVAIHILLEAQYGEKIFDKPMYSAYESCFRTCCSPTWEVKDMFSPCINDEHETVWDKQSKYFAK